MGVYPLVPLPGRQDSFASQAITPRMAPFSKPRYLVSNLDKTNENRYNIKVKKEFRLLL